MRLNLTDEPLSEVVRLLRTRLEALLAGEPLEFTALDPDLSAGHFSGERAKVSGQLYRHRPLRSWLELAERLGCRVGTPHREGHLVVLQLYPLAPSSWHEDKVEGREAYGPDSGFSRIDKLEEPTFFLDYSEALERAKLTHGSRILSLGVGRGDELEPLRSHASGMEIVGIDHSAGALEVARTRFPDHRFIEADLNDLGALELGRFDLVISLATFQSPGVEGHTLIRVVVQKYLNTQGSIVLALPNCRYRDGELLYGAKMKNYAQPDLSLLIKDAAFYRKYLQQHRFRVFLTGKHYLFLTAVRA